MTTIPDRSVLVLNLLLAAAELWVEANGAERPPSTENGFVGLAEAAFNAALAEAEEADR